MKNPRVIILIVVPVALVLIGTLGFYLLGQPEYSLFDSLYMTITTLTTVGYQEVHPLSTWGRVFNIFLLLGGVFTLFFVSGEILRMVVSGELRDYLGRQYMSRALAGLHDHVIVCGYGRMGDFVCQEFSKQGLPFVIVDRRTELLQSFEMPHGVPLVGDATLDEVLKRAGISRARALITVLASDADNLYITMSARLLNEKIFIVSRAEVSLAEPKLRRAGANRVVSPYASGGFRVAQAVLRPTVVDFLELATRTEHIGLQIEETLIEEGSRLDGATLLSSRVRQDLGVIIVAIKKADGQMVYNPPGDAGMGGGDVLIALGPRQQLSQLAALSRRLL
jgi:voltage-gated potassium channel